MAWGAAVNSTAMRPAPSVARFQNRDLNTVIAPFPQTAGAALPSFGGTPAATDIPRTFFAENSGERFPLYFPSTTCLVPACRADCGLLPTRSQAGDPLNY